MTKPSPNSKIIAYATSIAKLYAGLLPFLLLLNFWADAKITKAEMRIREALVSRVEAKMTDRRLTEIESRLDAITYRDARKDGFGGVKKK